MEKQTIGRFIATLRKANGYTQAQLAEKLGVSDKAVSRWERDETAPDLTLIPVIAELFGVTCDELLRGQRSAPQSEAEPAPAPQRSKHLRQLLKKSLTTYRVRSTVCIGISLLGLIAAMICNLAFQRAKLGLLIGCIFYGGAALCQWIFLTLGRSGADEEEFDNDTIESYRQELLRISLRTGMLILLQFCATLPLGMVYDSYMGLTAWSWAANAILFVAGGLVLLGLVWSVVSLLKGKDSTNPFPLQYRYCKITALTMAILLILYWVIGQFLPAILMHPITFDNWDDFKAYMERSDPTINYYEGTITEALPAPDGTIYYDNDGNEITEEEALTETITDKAGNVLCTYLHKNHNVSMYSYDLPTDNSPLNITIYTNSEHSRANFVTREIQEIYLLLFPITLTIIVLIYVRKKNAA